MQSGDYLIDQELGDLSLISPIVQDSVERAEQIIAGGGSVAEAAIIVAGVPVIMLIWRSIHTWATPFFSNLAESRRHKIENAALEERLQIRSRFPGVEDADKIS